LKIVPKNHTKNWDHRKLPELSFVPLENNDPLGSKTKYEKYFNETNSTIIQYLNMFIFFTRSHVEKNQNFEYSTSPIN